MFFGRRKRTVITASTALPVILSAKVSSSDQYRQQINGFKGSFLIFLAVTPKDEHLCLLDALTEAPQSPDTLARQCGWDLGKARQILLGLAGIQLLTMTPNGQFQPGPLGMALKSQPALRVEAELAARVLAIAAQQGLPYALSTGQDGFTHTFGMDFYHYLGIHGDDAQRFGTFMHLLTQPVADLFLQHYPALQERHTVVDIGAGDATLLSSIVRTYTSLHGIAFDRTTEVAQRTAALLGPDVAPRLRCVAGDYFASVPAGDALILMQVLHNLSDAQAMQVLTNCHAALEPGGVVLLIEQLLPTVVTELSPAVEQNVNMAILFATGRERTQEEYAALLSQTGLMLSTVIPLSPTSFSIIEARLR